jgi:hypothetical protein
MCIKHQGKHNFGLQGAFVAHQLRTLIREMSMAKERNCQLVLNSDYYGRACSECIWGCILRSSLDLKRDQTKPKSIARINSCCGSKSSCKSIFDASLTRWLQPQATTTAKYRMQHQLTFQACQQTSAWTDCYAL